MDYSFWNELESKSPPDANAARVAPDGVGAWLAALGFRGERHQLACLPDSAGGAAAAVRGLGSLASLEQLEPWHLAGAPDRLPGGTWHIATPLPAEAATAAALGWAHGSYRFERYRSRPRAVPGAVLVPPQLADMTLVRRMAAALAMARDLINTPAADLTPERLAHEALGMATRYGAHGRVLIPTEQALAAAAEFGLDLVEVSPNADPPVCKVMDYGRYRYEQTKKKHEAKKKQASFKLKEIKVRPKTGQHDLDVKIGRIKEFIGKKDKVKVTVMFRGREIALSKMGMELLEKIAAAPQDIAVVEQTPKFDNRTLFMVLAPR